MYDTFSMNLYHATETLEAVFTQRVERFFRLMPPCHEALRTQGGFLLVTCRVTPRARREHIACEGGKLRVWLHAPPVEGAANEALLELFVRVLNLPRRAITLERGATARRKIVAVEGLSEQEFWRRLGLTGND